MIVQQVIRFMLHLIAIGAAIMAVALVITTVRPTKVDAIMIGLVVLIVISQAITVVGRKAGLIR